MPDSDFLPLAVSYTYLLISMFYDKNLCEIIFFLSCSNFTEIFNTEVYYFAVCFMPEVETGQSPPLAHENVMPAAERLG